MSSWCCSEPSPSPVGGENIVKLNLFLLKVAVASLGLCLKVKLLRERERERERRDRRSRGKERRAPSPVTDDDCLVTTTTGHVYDAVMVVWPSPA